MIWNITFWIFYSGCESGNILATKAQGNFDAFSKPKYCKFTITTKISFDVSYRYVSSILKTNQVILISKGCACIDILDIGFCNQKSPFSPTLFFCDSASFYFCPFQKQYKNYLQQIHEQSRSRMQSIFHKRICSDLFQIILLAIEIQIIRQCKRN